MSEPADPRSLDALRRDRETPAPDDARARVASRLGVYAPLPKPGSHRSSATAASAPTVASARRVHTGSLLAITFVAGGAVGALLHAGFSSRPAARVVYVDRPMPSIASAAPSASSPSAPAPSAANSAIPAPSVPSMAASTPRPGLAQLDAERALLDAARVALVGGDSDTALRALDRHARTYARPILGEERDALFVQALVRAGRYDEARTRADAFRRRAPNSLFLSAVDAAIASIP
jgi:hypothetical protein